MTTQGTVATFDLQSQSGTVLLDDGLQLPFSAGAFSRSGLRSLRLGQRVRLEIAGGGDAQRITALTVVTLPLR
jgi:2-phospho-L-lactate guanylyltransferase